MMEASENSISLASPVAQFLFLKPVREAQCYHACHQPGVCEGSQNEIGFITTSVKPEPEGQFCARKRH
jgi:hypothetical protein